MKPLRLLGINESSGPTLAFQEPHGKDFRGLWHSATASTSTTHLRNFPIIETADHGKGSDDRSFHPSISRYWENTHALIVGVVRATWFESTRYNSIKA